MKSPPERSGGLFLCLSVVSCQWSVVSGQLSVVSRYVAGALAGVWQNQWIQLFGKLFVGDIGVRRRGGFCGACCTRPAYWAGNEVGVRQCRAGVALWRGRRRWGCGCDWAIGWTGENNFSSTIRGKPDFSVSKSSCGGDLGFSSAST